VLPGRKYTIEDVLRILWRRKWLILLPFVLSSVTTYLVAKRLPDVYKSETLILVVPQKVPEAYVRSTVSGDIEDWLSSLKQQILSRSRLERIIRDLDLYRDIRAQQPLERVIDVMRSAVHVDFVKGGEAFTVTYEARDPRVAQLVTSRLASLFIDENVHEREALAVGTSEFLQTQLDDARQRLIGQERRLEQYRLQHAGELPTQAPTNLQAVQTERAQLESLDDALARARERQVLLERQLNDLLVSGAAPLPAAAAAPAPVSDDPLEPAGATVSERLQDGRRKLDALVARGMKPEHPDVVHLKRRVAQLDAQFRVEQAHPVAASAAPVPALPSPRDQRARDLRVDLDAVKREIADKQKEQQKVQAEMAMYQSRLDAAPIREAELTELTRDYDTIQQIYRSLLAKREDSKVAANLEQRQVGQQFRVLDPAGVPERPFKPNRVAFDVGGLAFGLLLGLGLAGLLEYLDTTVKSEDDVRMLLNLPVIATIPILDVRAESRPPLGMRLKAALRG
jgi:polysaccharide chain length determinant protein (PEP-CTERM system associated)